MTKIESVGRLTYFSANTSGFHDLHHEVFLFGFMYDGQISIREFSKKIKKLPPAFYINDYDGTSFSRQLRARHDYVSTTRVLIG